MGHIACHAYWIPKACEGTEHTKTAGGIYPSQHPEPQRFTCDKYLRPFLIFVSSVKFLFIFALLTVSEKKK
jgi:hypothetical protein